MNKHLEEETLSSSALYRGKIINVRHDRVRLPNGKTAYREVVEHPGAVAILVLDERDRVILVRQHRQPAGAVLLEIPAGKLDPGESPLDCARRELAEETGLKAANWRPLGWFYLSPGYCDEMIHLFVAQGLSAAAETAKTDEEETVEVVTVPLQEALAWLDRGELKDAKTVIALQFARSTA